MNDGMKEATALCQACLDAMDSTDCDGEKFINIMVLTHALNQWTLGARLRLIQEKSKVVS